MINGKAGNDDIFNMAPNVKINSGKGNNIITSRDENVLITAGAGNDTISAFGQSTTIDAGDGKDIICGFENDDLLLITGAFSDTYNRSKTATSFNINGIDYRISGSMFVKK